MVVPLVILLIAVREVLEQGLEPYINNHPAKLTRHQIKVFQALMNCRTAKLGGHSNVCEDCGHRSIAYNSCRDRHCPMCQSFKREKWRVDQQAKLLNVHYFHVVFTVPEELNPLFLRNQRSLYALLMRCAAQTMMQLTADKKYLGAQVGMTGILHTWGQTLSYHPHVHFIVTGGGLCPTTQMFKRSNGNFLIPVKVLSTVFRAKFLKGLKALLAREVLQLGTLSQSDLKGLMDALYKKAFVTYVKESFASPTHVIKYLSQYTHRVAIADHRLIKLEAGQLTFLYKDYRDHSKQKAMTVSSDVFIQRLAMHILPSGFTKIRHYGLLASCNLNTKLSRVRKLLKMASCKSSKDYTAVEFIKKFIDANCLLCPKCQSERYHRLLDGDGVISNSS